MKLKSVRFEGELESGKSADDPWSNLNYSVTLFNLDKQVDFFSGILFPPIFGLAAASKVWEPALQITHAVIDSSWIQPAREGWKLVLQSISASAAKKYIYPTAPVNEPISQKIGLLIAFVPNVIIIPNTPTLKTFRTKLFKEKAMV